MKNFSPEPNIEMEDILDPTSNVRWAILSKTSPLRGEVSWHGYREFGEFGGHPGTWCFYLIVPQDMFPDRWLDFVPCATQYGWEHTSAFDDDWFHGGITFVDLIRKFDRKTERFREYVKVGCDYNHIWDEEIGFPYSLKSVKRDCQDAMEAFLENHPDYRVASGWSGLYGSQEEMILCRNGAYRHPEDSGWEDYQGWQSKSVDIPEEVKDFKL